MKFLPFGALLILVSFLLVTNTFEVTAQACKPSGQVKARPVSLGECDEEDDCCIPGKLYNTYLCSPSVSNKTKAVLSLNSFSDGGDLPTTCDTKYHSNNELVVGLSSGWYNKGERCHKMITVSANRKSVKALVIDECDSTIGCDADNAYQPPCQNNVVQASKAVWELLGIPENDWTELDITWSDA